MYRNLCKKVTTFTNVILLSAIAALPLSAHPAMLSHITEASIHFEPDGLPRAGRPSLTWFSLLRPNGNPIQTAHCDCSVLAFDDDNRAIAPNLPLADVTLDDAPSIGTAITFPNPGAYRVVLTVKPTDDSFEAFKLEFPVRVVMP